MQKIFFGILVQTALIVGQSWTIEKITPESLLLSLTIKINRVKCLKINHSLATQHTVYMPYIAHLLYLRKPVLILLYVYV